ncbi:DinB family protein [Dokdonia sp. PRO95]|uniref:DinB family protein n=1 Tax=Dokdonia sp. PRO95 TaxID=1239415 RepID=UPI00054DC7EE|nr:DinB family protein [Dokdonia sp. PRO95]
MTTSHLLSKHLQQFIAGPNLTGSHLSQHLDDVSIKEANISLYGVNSIAQLVFHINYYISAVGDVLEGKPLLAKDSLSFDAPIITTEAAWQPQKEKLYTAIHRCAQLVKSFPQEKLKEEFVLKKYGSYEHNLLGLLEHSHYHFGQIVIIKKMLRAGLR